MEIIIAVVFIVVLIVVAMYISLQKKEIVEETTMPLIHTSGIYSVIRKSPRENIFSGKPAMNEVQAFVNCANQDFSGQLLTDTDKVAIYQHYEKGIEKGIAVIEAGDKFGVQRFQIVAGSVCSACGSFRGNKLFVTREDLFRHPELIPPFYPGCQCTLQAELECLLDSDFKHFTIENGPFPLPSWKNINKV